MGQETLIPDEQGSRLMREDARIIGENRQNLREGKDKLRRRLSGSRKGEKTTR